MIGLPLNRHLTISWRTAGTPGRVQDAQGRFLELASKWLKYHGVPPTFVWVIENGSVLGHHSHIALHLPANLARKFRTMANRWVKKIGGDPHTRGAIKITRDAYERTDYRKAVRGLLKYILKGLEHEAAHLLGITPNYEKAGFVVGKRCGTSENIGPAARARAAQSSP